MNVDSGYEFVYEIELFSETGEPENAETMERVGDAVMDYLLDFTPIVDPIVSSGKNTLVMQGLLHDIAGGSVYSVSTTHIHKALEAAGVHVPGEPSRVSDRDLLTLGSHHRPPAEPAAHDRTRGRVAIAPLATA